MKKIFQKSGAFIMAFLLLFSTMSFAVEMHFCGKVLVDKTVFSETESCCADSDADSSSSEKKCCNDENITIEGQKELNVSFHQLDFEQQNFLAAFSFSYFNLFEPQPEQVVPFKNYSPPLLVSDIQLLDQIFII